jgi:hypothetical protein
VKVGADMSENAKNEPKGAARRTVSLDPELNAFAEQRMVMRGIKMFSHYIQDLVREDTAALRLQSLEQNQNTPVITPAPAPRSGNETAPHARRSNSSYGPKKTSRQ